MLRVLHVVTRLELGGAQRNTLYTAANLDRKSFAVGLAWGPGDRLDDEARALADVMLFEIPALVRPISPAHDIRALARVRRVIRTFHPDIVHTHSSKAGIVGRTAARLERAPIIVHSIHGWGFTPLQSRFKRRLLLVLERRVSAWTDHYIAVSRANLDQGRRLGIVGEGATVIRSGIDLSAFMARGDRAAARARWNLPREAPVVTQVGNFKPQKAPLDFVGMAARVASRRADVHFVLAGDGPLRARIEAAVSAAGLNERCHLIGWCDDVPALLRATDVAVLSSRHEGLPRAVVEARAAGVPVVATAVDGTPEAVEDGVSGFLVPPAGVDELAARVTDLLDDEDLRRAMGRRAREGLDEWNIDAMVRRQEELYRWLHYREN